MIKPLPQYENYFCNTNCSHLIGIDKDGLHGIKIIDVDENPTILKDFFIKEKMMYITALIQEDTGTLENPKIEYITHFYSQKNGSIKEIETVPDKPIAGYSVYASKKFVIEKGEYKGQPLSRIFNLTMRNLVVFKQIFGFCELKTGLYFNVIESMIPGRAEGLYFYSIDRKAVNYVDVSFGPGFLW
jgi:hypothetical protein